MKHAVCRKETALHVALYLLGSLSAVLFAMIIGTGNPLPEVPLRFIGSVTIAPFVWHVFEELR